MYLRLFLLITATWVVGRVFLILAHFELLSPVKIPVIQSIGIHFLVFFVGIIFINNYIDKHGTEKLKYSLLILFGMIAIFFYFDIGNNYVQEWKSNKEIQKEIELQASTESYYKDKLDKPYIFNEYIWYSTKRTFYVFEKNGGVSKEDIEYIINIIKPLDNQDISIQLISQTTPYQIVMSYTNEKVLIGCTNPPFNNLDKINICVED
ncbi:hypothetical protein [Gorillibacterium massiliense]|uniref:hypothetical protein n=1 Tax=Gorillibacterium massiliense TaxID=1280390 RepID=UPI0005952D5F|nr:hypothetical protein [Gorillibacterium massiliense]